MLIKKPFTSPMRVIFTGISIIFNLNVSATETPLPTDKLTFDSGYKKIVFQDFENESSYRLSHKGTRGGWVHRGGPEGESNAVRLTPFGGKNGGWQPAEEDRSIHIFPKEDAFDASSMSHLRFDIKDTDNNNSAWVMLKDCGGQTASSWTDDKAVKNQWTLMSLELDKHFKGKIDLSCLKEVIVGEHWSGDYFISQVHFLKEKGEEPDYGKAPPVAKKDGSVNIPVPNVKPLPSNSHTSVKPVSKGSFQTFFQNGHVIPSFDKHKGREYISLDGDWRYQYAGNMDTDSLSLKPRTNEIIKKLQREAGDKLNADFDDHNWETSQVPMPINKSGYKINDYNGNGNEDGLKPSDSMKQYGGAWYRKQFHSDGEWKGKTVKLNFHSVSYTADVWLNGHYLGHHNVAHLPFSFDVGEHLNQDDVNTLLVRVDNKQTTTATPGINDPIYFPPKRSDWWTYTGVLRQVYLEVSNTLHIARADVRPIDIQGRVEITTTLNNKGVSDERITVEHNIYQASVNENNILSEFADDLKDGVVERKAITHTVKPNHVGINRTSLTLPNVRLWSMKTPNLYVLESTVMKGGVILDKYQTQFGVRTLSTEKHNIHLNDKVAPFLAGIGRTEDHKVYGPSMPNKVILDDLKIIKHKLNANFVRTGHFPSNLNTNLYADRLGLAIWEEIPVYWVSEKREFDKIIRQGQARQMIQQMVLSNYNRPSVWFWGTMNESGDQTGRLELQQQLKQAVRPFDDTRLIAQAIATEDRSRDASLEASDVVGLNLYDETHHRRFDPGNQHTNFDHLKEQQGENLDLRRSNHPDKPILITEFGRWSYDNNYLQNDQAEVFSQAFNQVYAKRAAWLLDPVSGKGVYNPEGPVAGATWWTAFNWFSPESETTQTMGVIQMNRTMLKPIAEKMSKSYQQYNSVDTGHHYE
ncbi:glycoside hydrolase family 2 protein [Vibrio nomapromontoriensis]|uniref:glycoside hydrolase family 2 protein n=1 Tax=Vibrio nomapromontoriensis TaxID=2910246 RepID=UPI003D0FDD55